MSEALADVELNAEIAEATKTASAPPVEEKKKEESPNPIIKDVTSEGAQGAADKLKFQKSFTFEYDAEDGTHYYGAFTVKRMTLGDYSRMGVIKGSLNGGELVDRNIQWLHETMSLLAVALTDTPPWWNPEELYDSKILDEVYEVARAFQATFRKRSMD